jgi:hypothetical protein
MSNTQTIVISLSADDHHSARIGDFHKLSQVGQPFSYCGIAILSKFIVFHHILQLFE